MMSRGWRRIFLALLTVACVAVCMAAGQASAGEAMERAMSGQPPVIVLCDEKEPGQTLNFMGRVLDYEGRPLPKASVVAYHTDHQGLYNPPDSDTRVPRIRGVAVTDAKGRFQFHTIRPAAYPEGTQPAHIHLAVTAPAHHVKWMEIWFDDDPLVTEPLRRQAASGTSTVIVKPRKEGGAWSFSQDIRLEGS